jgi:metallo-beta-lactamase family protein
MKITFEGAAENVTGSKHLIEAGGYRLLLDCGLYQGRRQESEQMNRVLPFDAASIDAVILSHAHADHCGALPVLVKNGFAGKIYSTDATAEIARLIMMDSAKIQEEDAAYLNRHRIPGAIGASPLYSEDDVSRACERFVSVKYFRDSGAWTALTPQIRFKLYDAGHILGSAVVVVQVTEGGATKTVAFTGDLGNVNVPLMRPPEPIADDPVDALLMECTYGDRNHRPFADAGVELAGIIKTAVQNKSKIIVPAFSLGRTQELIYALHKLHDQKMIPALPIYIDSPLSVDILDVFNRHTEYFDKETWSDFGVKGEEPFIFDDLIYVRTIGESKALNVKSGPFMVISASGMAEGGRIRHHLLNGVSDPNNFVLITGYQAAHTLGRKLQEGVSPVNILGEARDVRAKVITLHEFSAHADQAGLLDYLSKTNGLKHLYLVHTEAPQDQIFEALARKKYPGLDVEIPALGMTVEI